MRKKMKNKEEKHSSSKFFKGVFWGVVAGTILGMLYAPEEGKKTRKKIKILSDEATVEGKKVVKKAKTKVEKFKEEAEPIIEQYKEKLSEIAETIDKESIPVRDALEDAVDSVSDGAKRVSKKYFKGTKKR